MNFWKRSIAALSPLTNCPTNYAAYYAYQHAEMLREFRDGLHDALQAGRESK
jgi:hypothetical protein